MFDEAKEELEELEQTESIAPFTLEDAALDPNYCITCKNFDKCPIIIYVNSLEKIRAARHRKPARTLEEEFSCSIYKQISE